ncbi:Glycosyl hydrolases family 2, TIM barrel domain [Chitinophaga rupis]|uniref:Glycosyl hydrolases family 2, TIM barrel domain n=1 Tax=Chitinophaga rupis TaxID=573321 RepID=A0A1H7Y040_9BACT|nr:sugar-binding domain-containing protein [Chitinophaga rupis]SEM38707.1 Glycosyl hydrolases family 2, TIM barrel domain [Chitinophaga rupis]
MYLKKYIILIFILGASVKSDAQKDWSPQPSNIKTRWAQEVSPTNALKEYPRPQMVRKGWTNLNGLWDYAIVGKDVQMPKAYQGKILVPFPLESSLSGVKRALLPEECLWYHKDIIIKRQAQKRVLLNFGAIDNNAIVYVNGEKIGGHEGGYTNFSIDITDALKDGSNEILVKVSDATEQGVFPHGKQVLHPENIYYTPSSGIWQTVWLESVPDSHISKVRFTPDIDKGILNLQVNINGIIGDCNIEAIAYADGRMVSNSRFSPADSLIELKIADPSEVHLWSPVDPFLYDLKIRLIKDGKIVDEISSYFGMRKIAIHKDKAGFERIFLNNQYTYNLGTLDQGFWPDGLMTAPTDEALAFDIKAIKAMGFNTIRKHIKIEPARWYYHADKLGMLVWQDFVNPNQALPEGAKTAFEVQTKETLDQLHNYPSIITWVLFNEQWGSYDQQRLTEWVKAQDPSRLVNGHSGEYIFIDGKETKTGKNNWISSDMTDIHSYPDPTNPPNIDGKVMVLGEFGGIGVFVPDHQWNPSNAWGYAQVTASSLKGKYAIMTNTLRLLEREGLSGSIYTQPFDVESEQNGLITYDREIIKIPFEEIRSLNEHLVEIGKVPAVTAMNADLSDPAIIYSKMMDEYIQGRNDTVFLYKLAVAARQVSDKPGVHRISNEYIAKLSRPYSKEKLEFIMENTFSTKDPGFKILQAQLKDTASLLEQRTVTMKLMNSIFTDSIEPFLKDTTVDVDWNDIEKSIKEFGNAGEEIFLRAKTIYYYNKTDWKNYAPVAAIYLSKYGKNIIEQEKKVFESAMANK